MRSQQLNLMHNIHATKTLADSGFIKVFIHLNFTVTQTKLNPPLPQVFFFHIFWFHLRISLLVAFFRWFGFCLKQKLVKLKNMLVKLDIFPKFRGFQTTNIINILWNHHQFVIICGFNTKNWTSPTTLGPRKAARHMNKEQSSFGSDQIEMVSTPAFARPPSTSGHTPSTGKRRNVPP